jgi:type II secretory pathway component PulJ
MTHQKGLGLPELLIALMLSSFIMTGLMHHYLSAKKQYTDIQKKLERSIDLQLVTDLMRDSIRRAGFTPCLSINHLITLDQRSEPKHLVAVELGSDTTPWLRISRMNEHFDTVLKITSQTRLSTTNTHLLHHDQSILITDCYHAEVQKVGEATHTIGNQNITFIKPLAFAYHEPIFVGEWLEETYSIRIGSDGKKALFYQHQHAEELTTAVHTMAARLNSNQRSMLLQIILGLDKEHALELETMVRAS